MIPKKINAKPVIIDFDPGIDDAMALLLALGSPYLNIIAITTVFGNHPNVNLLTQNAIKLLDLAKVFNIPVYQGCGKPISYKGSEKQYVDENDNLVNQSIKFHGITGMGDVSVNKILPSARENLNKEHAVDKIIELVTKNPKKITLIAIGPLTNLATVLQKNNSVGSLFKKVIVMGGALFGPRGNSINTPGANIGNVKASVEANFNNDPEAAAIVFSSSSINSLSPSVIPYKNLILIPLDTTTQTNYLKSGLGGFLNTSGKIGKFLFESHDFYSKAYKKFGQKIVPLHDSCAILYAINSNYFKDSHYIDVRIDLGTIQTKGRSIIENRKKFNMAGVDKYTPRTTYFEKINKEKLYQSIKKSIIVLEKHILSKK